MTPSQAQIASKKLNKNGDNKVILKENKGSGFLVGCLFFNIQTERNIYHTKNLNAYKASPYPDHYKNLAALILQSSWGYFEYCHGSGTSEWWSWKYSNDVIREKVKIFWNGGSREIID